MATFSHKKTQEGEKGRGAEGKKVHRHFPSGFKIFTNSA
jgi:hypothetical protein